MDRLCLCEYGQELSGAIIMGTGHQPKALVQFARSTCRALAAVHGWQYRSKLVARMSQMVFMKLTYILLFISGLSLLVK